MRGRHTNVPTSYARCAGTACKPYAALFEEVAWRELAELFRKDLYRMHSMPLESQLSIHLQVITTRNPAAGAPRRRTHVHQIPRC